ncbi:MAG: stress response translation initiation inhibitor YciH [Porticoccus sp.]
MSKETRLVYSTETGRIKSAEESQKQSSGDGVVRIRREVSGRKGKGVSTINGLDLPDKDLKQLAKQLKQLCGTGGSVKNGVIEIQGDHRDKLLTELENQGYTVKLAGG